MNGFYSGGLLKNKNKKIRKYLHQETILLSTVPCKAERVCTALNLKCAMNESVTCLFTTRDLNKPLSLNINFQHVTRVTHSKRGFHIKGVSRAMEEPFK